MGGCAGIEQAAKNAGHDITVPFTPGRTDASQEQTDVNHFAVLEPSADGFRNYINSQVYRIGRRNADRQSTTANVNSTGNDRLVGGMRVLNTNFDQSQYGVFTKRPGKTYQRLFC